MVVEYSSASLPPVDWQSSSTKQTISQLIDSLQLPSMPMLHSSDDARAACAAYVQRLNQSTRLTVDGMVCVYSSEGADIVPLLSDMLDIVGRQLVDGMWIIATAVAMYSIILSLRSGYSLSM